MSIYDSLDTISNCRMRLFCNDYSYFKDGLKTIAHFGTYIHDLSTKLQSIKQKQDEERRKLLELRTLLRSAPDFDRIEVRNDQRYAVDMT